MLTHSHSRLITLSNNPSGKNVKLLASSSLQKHQLIKVILFHKFKPQCCHYNLSKTDPWLLQRKPPNLSDNPHKLVLTHSHSRLITLSNNPSGKNVKLLASSSLQKHQLIKVILFHKFKPQCCHYNLSKADPWLLQRKPPNLSENPDKLVLTHSHSRLITLSNNPSGKNVKLLASSSL